MRFGTRDLNLPVPVKVVFAEDTTMVTLTDASLPGLGTFTARVLSTATATPGCGGAPTIPAISSAGSCESRESTLLFGLGFAWLDRLDAESTYAAGSVATLVLRSGNLGGAVTGTRFDYVRIVPGPSRPRTRCWRS